MNADAPQPPLDGAPPLDDALPLDAAEVARLLVELGRRIELAGDSPYKARAYFRAAESLAALPVPLEALVEAGRLRDIPGVGEAIEEKIAALHRTGAHRTLERLRAEAPAGLLDMLDIPGIGAREVRAIHKALGLDRVEALEEACRAGKLAPVKGLGPALERKILQGIELRRQSRGQRLIHHAEELLEGAAAGLARAYPELSRIMPAGDFRRGCELVSDLRIAAAGAPIARDASSQISLHVAEPPRFGVALLFATGSAEHLRDLQAFAAAGGFALDETGLRRGRRRIPCPEEADVYRALGLQFIPPELREGLGEVALAAENRLPVLVEDSDIRGILHSHTDRSDGAVSLAEMADAVRRRGYQYYGVADHSQSAGYAGGLSPDEIAAQHAEADALNAGYGGAFRIFKGIESDIRQDGSLDYPDEILRSFDFVVASVHSRFALEEKTQTERILRAVASPHTTILGHPTGRLLLRRPPYELDVDAVLKACAAHGVAVEVNGNPHRLDLDWRWLARALELGCTLSLNPDAHSVAELDLTRWAVVMARKGGVPKDRVLNCLGVEELAGWLEGRRV